MDGHKRWKIKFSILMVILIIIIYGSNYLVLGDAEHIISYIWTHLGFIPVDILVVAFLLVALRIVIPLIGILHLLPHSFKQVA